jgi:hypothetical protein
VPVRLVADADLTARTYEALTGADLKARAREALTGSGPKARAGFGPGKCVKGESGKAREELVRKRSAAQQYLRTSEPQSRFVPGVLPGARTLLGDL